MKARDVMSARVISITPDADVLDAIELMLSRHISGLPVIDRTGALVGIITEGDFLRRAETGTERKRPRWVEFLRGPRRLAEDYVHTHGRKVEEVMTRDPITVTEEAPLAEIVRLMERRRIKRVPVMRGSQIVGIVSRSNLMHALASLGRNAAPATTGDAAIRAQLLAEFDRETWAPIAMIDVVVKDGVVELWGTITEESQRDALRVAAENVPGVTKVVSHLTWIDPLSGMVIDDPEDAALEINAGR